MSMSTVEMEEMLCDAAFRGDVAALAGLLARDPKLLDKHYLKCEDKNVLHLAAMLGYVEFFKAVLQANSSFCHDMCLARDRDGKNPIHLAASHGKLNILNLIKNCDWVIQAAIVKTGNGGTISNSVKNHDWLIQAAMEKTDNGGIILNLINSHDSLIQAAMEKTDNGGTILHLCVKHNQLGALIHLLEIFTDLEFQNAKNEDGMTILHLAFYYNQNKRMREVINFLVRDVPRIVNSKTANGKTALDLFLREAGIGELSLWRRKKRMCQYDSEMADSLLEANAEQGRDIIDSNQSGFEKRRDAIMVVASLIATMAFQAMISPPGGTWQDDSNSHRVGESVMANTHPKYYKHLIQANTVAFVSSLSVIILLVRGMSISPHYFFALSSIVMWLAVAAISVVYSISLVVIVPESARGSNMSATSLCAFIPIMVWSLILTAIVVGRCKRGRNPITPTLALYSLT